MSENDFRSLYQDLLIDHSRQRHGYGLLPTADSEMQAQAHRVNRSCGDEITLRVNMHDSAVDSVTWEGQGCAISQASASMLVDLMSELTPTECTRRVDAFRAMLQSRGKDEGSLELLGDAVALSGVSIYLPRIDCAMLAWLAFEDSLDQLSRNRTTQTITAPADPEV